MVHQDNTTESWTYDTFSRVTTHADELTRQSLYSYSDYAGKPGATEKLTMRHVVGSQLAESTDPDDLFTDLYFTSLGLLQREVVRRRDYNGTVQTSFGTVYA